MAEHTAETLGLNLPADAPIDGSMIWTLADCGEILEVAYHDEASFWMKVPTWSRQDGEAGHVDLNQMVGWTTDAGLIAVAADRYLNEEI